MTKTIPIGSELRNAIKEHGTPLTIEDSNGKKYVILEIKVTSSPSGNGYRATFEDYITIYGEGDTEKEARCALCKVMKDLSNEELR